MTPTLFESLPQRFSNIDKLSFNYNRINRIICGHQIENYKCFQCIVRVFESMAELNCLKVLQVIHYKCETLKAFQSNINQLKFSSFHSFFDSIF